MITITRLDKRVIVLNADLIKSLEATPDTILTLINGDTLVVRESVEEIVQRVVEYQDGREAEEEAGGEVNVAQADCQRGADQREEEATAPVGPATPRLGAEAVQSLAGLVQLPPALAPGVVGRGGEVAGAAAFTTMGAANAPLGVSAIHVLRTRFSAVTPAPVTTSPPRRRSPLRKPP